MNERVLRGTDWMRHEEEVARIRQERNNQTIWDVGVDRSVQECFAPDTVKAMVNMAPDGITIIRCNGTLVYIYKDSNAKRAEVGLRSAMVQLWGEEIVKEIDALLLEKGEQAE